MQYRPGVDDSRWWSAGVMSGVVAMSLCASMAVSAQEVRRLEPGPPISVRKNDTIDVDRQDNRVYTGIVEQDVRGSEGRILIPRGSPVELFVRLARDNDLILDLESVVANGVRYAVKTDPNRVESRPDDFDEVGEFLVGAIVGAIRGGEVRGRAVRVRRASVIRFR